MPEDDEIVRQFGEVGEERTPRQHVVLEGPPGTGVYHQHAGSGGFDFEPRRSVGEQGEQSGIECFPAPAEVVRIRPAEQDHLVVALNALGTRLAQQVHRVGAKPVLAHGIAGAHQTVDGWHVVKHSAQGLWGRMYIRDNA